MISDFDTKMAEANATLRNGNIPKAQKMLEDVVATATDKKDKAIALSALGRLYCILMQYQMARATLKEACDLLDAVGYANTLPFAEALVYLGRSRTALDDLEGGKEVGRSALAILDSLPTSESSLTAEACFMLSQAEYQLRHLDVAERLTNRAMTIWEKIEGRESMAVSTCLNNLGRICEENGELEQGISLHRRCLEIRKKILGDHPETAFSLGNLGTALAAAEQWKEATEILRECVDCYTKLGINDARPESYRRNLEICLLAMAEN